MENKDIIVMDNQNEVVAQNDSFDILGNETILMLADQAEKRIEAMNKIMKASLKMTTVNDWVLIGGIPYLQESGATKVARLFGISWQIEEPKKETRADGHYTITYKGKFSLAGATIEAEGARMVSKEYCQVSEILLLKILLKVALIHLNLKAIHSKEKAKKQHPKLKEVALNVSIVVQR